MADDPGRSVTSGHPPGSETRMMHFGDRWVKAVQDSRNAVVVGIDPRPEFFPQGFLDRFGSKMSGRAEAVREFGCRVVDVILPLVPAVKFQAAFYEIYGPAGMEALQETA